MSVTNRIILKTNSNGVDPTGFTSGSLDAPTMLRKVASLVDRAAQGACSANMNLAFAPVAALATVTTTNGAETTGDSLTVGNVAIGLVSTAQTATAAHITAGTSGTSTSGASPVITTASANMSFLVNINGDGAQQIVFNDGGTHTGAAIAAVIQTAIRALTPNNALNAVAFSSATCSYSSTYVITSGVAGSNSTVVVTSDGTTGSTLLKLGVVAGGTEATGTATTLNNIATVINSTGTGFSGMCTAYACGNILTLTAFVPGVIGNGLALAVSTTGAVMSITHAWGAATAGTEGTSKTFAMGL